MIDFISITIASLIGAISPGPNFALTVRLSLIYGKRIALWCAGGLATGVMMHVAYTLAGLGIVIQKFPLFFFSLKYFCAFYFLYQGIKDILAKPHAPATFTFPDSPSSLSASHPSLSPLDAWRKGFITSSLNLTTSLFFIGFFSVVFAHSCDFSPLVKVGYVLWIGLIELIWFSLVSIFFSIASIRLRFEYAKHWVERLTGLVFIILGLRILTLSPMPSCAY